MRNVLVHALTSSIQFSNNLIRISKKCPNKFVPLRDLFSFFITIGVISAFPPQPTVLIGLLLAEAPWTL